LKKHHNAVLLAFLALLGFFIWQATKLEPEPDFPNVLPASNNYEQVLSLEDRLFSTVTQQQIYIELVLGIKADDPARRKGDPALVETGSANFEPIDISTPEAQEALANLCYHAAGVEDLNGFVDSSAENRLVWGYTPETQGLDVAENLGAILHCPILDFRNWLVSDTRGYDPADGAIDHKVAVIIFLFAFPFLHFLHILRPTFVFLRLLHFSSFLYFSAFPMSPLFQFRHFSHCLHLFCFFTFPFLQRWRRSRCPRPTSRTPWNGGSATRRPTRPQVSPILTPGPGTF
jgi:hypothetical protein